MRTRIDFALLFLGANQEGHQLRRERGGWRHARSEAKDLLLGEQSGSAHQGAQAVSSGQCRFALRIAQA